MGDQSTVVLIMDALTKQAYDIVRSEYDYADEYGPVSLHSIEKIFIYIDAFSLRRLTDYTIPNARKALWRDIKSGKYDECFAEARKYKMTDEEKETYKNFVGGEE